MISSSLKDEKQIKHSIQQSNTFSFSNNIIKNIKNIENIKNKFILNSLNILFTNTSCTRKSTRKTIYNLILIKAFTNNKKIFYATFLTFLFIIVSKNIKLHKNNLSSKFKYYKNMIKHSLASEFVQIIFTKIEIFQSKDTWKQMFHQHAQKTKKTFILTTWVFKYKLNIENFLIKYKVRLCVKNNLQSIEQNVYAATLTYKIFKAFMTIINV